MRISGIKVGRHQPTKAEMAVLTLGFRPFFLLATSFAVLELAVWLGLYMGGYDLKTYYGGTLWHGHEMIFGYATAVIAGFLLTAVPNWTGRSTPKGKPLAALAILWVAGRVLPFFPQNVPHWLIAAVDIAFLPVLIGTLASPLIITRQHRNLVFLLLLGLLVFANSMIHLDVLGNAPGAARAGINLGINLLVLFIAIIGGRVIPFFAERALSGLRTRRWALIEALALSSLMLLAATEFVYPDPLFLGLLSILAFLTHAVRLSGWYSNRIWSVPILWVLYLGYGWLVLGFALKALVMLGAFSPLLALHGFTVGGIGVVTLGMMARVALGHTGRAMTAAKPIVIAFVLLNLAALARVLVPIAFPHEYLFFIAASGALWILAFSIFIYSYTPILIAPRVDLRQ